MGQYYSVRVENLRNGEQKMYSARNDIKLYSFCWHKHPFASYIASLLYKNPCRIAVIGDEADEDDYNLISKKFKPFNYENDENYHTFNRKDTGRLLLYGKYLVNHTKREFMDYDAYAKRSIDCNGRVIHPLIMLTVTRTRSRFEMFGLGFWLGDVISIEDTFPRDFKEVDYTFKVVERQNTFTNISKAHSYLIEDRFADKVYEAYVNSEIGKVTAIAEDLDWCVYVNGDETAEFYCYASPVFDARFEVPVKNVSTNIIDYSSRYMGNDEIFERKLRELAETVKELV